MILNIASEYMKNVVKYVIVAAALVVVTVVSTGCFRQDYVIYEEGEFEGEEF